MDARANVPWEAIKNTTPDEIEAMRRRHEAFADRAGEYGIEGRYADDVGKLLALLDNLAGELRRLGFGPTANDTQAG